MKCKYCNADIEQDAQFCTNCGKDLSKFNKCVKCGELLDDKTDFCPYCGTEQPHEVVVDEENVSSKKWIWAVVGVLLVALIGGGYYYLSQNEGKTSRLAEAVDSDSIAVVDTEYDIHSVDGIKARLDEILKNGLSIDDESVIKKYFSQDFQQLNRKVEEFDAKLEGPGFWNGNIWDGGQDGNPNGFTINSVNSSTGTEAYADVKFSYDMDEYHSATYVSIALVFENGNWYIDSVDRNKEGMKEYISQSANEATYDGIVTISELRNGKSIEAVLSSLDYRHKKVENDRGYVTVYWYKNCDLDNQLEVVKPVNKDASVVEEFDGMSASVRITVFDEQIFEDLKNQTLQYCKKDGNGAYQFDWGDGEKSQGCVNMGKSDFRKGGYYIDIPL